MEFRAGARNRLDRLTLNRYRLARSSSQHLRTGLLRACAGWQAPPAGKPNSLEISVTVLGLAFTTSQSPSAIKTHFHI